MIDRKSLGSSVTPLWVLKRLEAAYGQPSPRRQMNPLDELVLTMLSQNTSDMNSHRAFQSLKRVFPKWDRVLRADQKKLAETIRVAGLSEIRAARIQKVLKEIKSRFGSLNLASLSSMNSTEAYEFLKSLTGVGPKTAACVMLFSLSKPFMPVDTHIHRVSLRLGLIEKKTTTEAAQQFFMNSVPGSKLYSFHIDMIRHGRAICRARTPLCPRCVLNSRCRYYSQIQPSINQIDRRRYPQTN